MRKLEVLDWSWYVFRAYYWFPDLTNEDGQNINAVYGFFRMLFTLWKRRPDEFVIAWDSPKKTKRKQYFADYKANRPKMPDDFKWQMQLIKQLVKELEIHHLEIPWYEADDIIATIVEHEIGEWCHHKSVTIVSSDKDLKQLLRDGVTQFDALKNIETTKEAFIQHHKFTPPQLRDYLSLVWDSSDNIPWVRGIGKKWAQKLIEQYGSIDNIYEHIDEIQGATQTKLKEGIDNAYLSRKLIDLMDVPDLQVEDNWTCAFDFERMEAILVDKYQFWSLQKMIDDLRKQRQWWQQYSLFW